MKTILLLLTFSILINIQTNAQRDNKSNGRGQESGHLERIERNQDRKTPTNNPQRKIKIEPKRPVVKIPKRSPKRNDGTPFCGETESYCPEKTPICGEIIDISYYHPSNEELAIQCFESGDFEGALLNVEIAIKSDLFNPSPYFLRGKIYFELNDYIQAIRDFTTVNDLDPLFPDAYYYRGMSNLYLGEMKLAMEDFKIAASLGDTLAESFLVRYSN